MFRGIENAQMSRGGNWIQPGKFVLMLDFLKVHINTVKNGEQFIAEFFVLYSTNPNQPAGSKVSWCASSWHPSAAGNIKAFFVSLLGIQPQQVTEAGCAMAVSPQQPMQGKLVLAEAYNKKTQKTGSDFTAINWGNADASWQQRAVELVKTLGIALTPKDQINQPPAQTQGFGGGQPQPFPQQPNFAQPQGFPTTGQPMPGGFGPPTGFPPAGNGSVPF